MATPTDTKHIVQDSAILGGKPCIEGHRIAVHHIAWWYQQGQTAEQIAREYHLTPAQAHAALVYYYDHQAEIDRELNEDLLAFNAQADADHSPIAERMRNLIAERKQTGA